MLKPTDIVLYLASLPRERSALILGPPGVGKSFNIISFARYEASKMGLNFVEYSDSLPDEELLRSYVFVELDMNTVEPSDLLGIPRSRAGYAFYKPLKWAHVLSRAPAGLLLLDDVTNVNRLDVISAMYRIILSRRIGFLRIPDTVRIVAAGNRPDESTIARLLPSPLLNRFHVVEIAPPTIDEWAQFMQENFRTYDKRVLAYLKRFPEDFIRIPAEGETLNQFPTPRSWTWLATDLLNTSREFIQEKCIGYLGAEVGSRLASFLAIRVDELELLRKPELFLEYDEDRKWLAITLLSRVDPGFYLREIEAFVRFLSIAGSESREYVMLFLKLLPAELSRATLDYLMNPRSAEARKLMLLIEQIADSVLATT